MARQPLGGQGLLVSSRFHDHTLRHTTLDRTPLDEGPARRRDLYLTTHNTHNRHPCPRWDSNPQSQQASGCTPTPQTARPLGSAMVYFNKYRLHNTAVPSNTTAKYKLHIAQFCAHVHLRRFACSHRSEEAYVKRKPIFCLKRTAWLFIVSLSTARDVPADAGFLCHVAAVVGDTIKGTLCDIPARQSFKWRDISLRDLQRSSIPPYSMSRSSPAFPYT
jgi:hypothetical protein